MPSSLAGGGLAGHTAARHRAAAMRPDDRRQAIIEATLPLLCELGASVTTSQIARAAGIAEGTIFRVFEAKHDLLLAALAAAMSADAEVARIAEISLEVPLAERLVGALAATSDYQDRLWSLIRLFRHSGLQHHGEGMQHKDHLPRQQMERIGDAIARLFEPERALLRQEPRTCARLLLGLAFASRLHEPEPSHASLQAVQLVDLFLNGAFDRSIGGEHQAHV